MPVKVGNAELSDEEVKELRDVFELVDVNKDGFLSAEEVKELMQMLGVRARLREVEQLIKEIDKDNSGTVDFDEFLQVVAKPQQLSYTKADLLRSFRMFADAGAPEGCITPEALEKALLLHCGDQVDAAEISRLVHSLDTAPENPLYINFHDKVSLFLSK